LGTGRGRTREHYQSILDDHLLPTFGSRQVAAIKPKDVRAWYDATLTDRPTMRSHAYSLVRTIMGSAINDELIDANPCRIVGAGRAKRVKKIRPASIEEVRWACSPQRCPRSCG
jgi:Phage integrase, N-terminal SAM-like domain